MTDQGPLANLPQATQQIITGNGVQRQSGELESMALGALAGVAVAAWTGHNRKTRGQSTTPGFRAVMVWLAFVVPALVATMAVHWQASGLFLAAGLALGAVFAVRYYRRTPKSSLPEHPHFRARRTGGPM